MRFDTWTIEQKTDIDTDYQTRFGGQIRILKKLFKTKQDPILFDELLENISSDLYLAIQLRGLSHAEALLERIKNAYDIKKLIRMIMHVGLVYDKLLSKDPDTERHINDYRLLDGFDPDFVPESGQGHTKKTIN